MDFKAVFEGKKITVMGLGLLGRGVGDTAFLAEMGAELIVTDLKTKEELEPSRNKLSAFPNISYTLGEHRFEDFENRDLILVAAGVPFDSPHLAHAQERDIPLTMSAALFAKHSGIPMIGVTGTRGKSTVTHMIHHVLGRHTAEGGEGIILGGNIRGVSNLQLLKDVREESVAVFELDSWQLQGFGWEGVSPHVAVFASFMDDHLNYYKGDTDHYFADKAQIFLNQNHGDVLVTTPSVFRRIEAFATARGVTLRGAVQLADESVLPDGTQLLIPGSHNYVNAGIAAETLRTLGVPDDDIKDGLETFRSVPGRLERIGEWRGVVLYNDNNATTPDALRAGIEAVANGKNVVLLCGGADKQLPLDMLSAVFHKYVKLAYVLPGTGSDLLRTQISDAISVATLKEGVTEALANAENGDVFLFSPGFASFGLFKNEYDRNDQFGALVTQYL